MTHVSVIGDYLLYNLYKLNSDSFYEQVRALQTLTAFLDALGDNEARKIHDILVKYEPEALSLDHTIRHYLYDLQNGFLDGLPDYLRERIEYLRSRLERFKAIVLVEIHRRFKDVVPSGVGIVKK